MKIMTLNMAMFNLQIDNSLDCFLNEYNPDVAIIQEFRSSKIVNYNTIKPNLFKGYIDARYFITMALCKDNIWHRNDLQDLEKYNRCFVKLDKNSEGNSDFSILGVHIPAETDNRKDELKELLSKLSSVDSNIICGDFNASSRKSNTLNFRYLQYLISKKGYSNLWEKCLKDGTAYYIDYRGCKQRATSNIRTFVGNTHIDYILGKDVEINEIILDMRTLAFTDHCAIIVDLK